MKNFLSTAILFFCLSEKNVQAQWTQFNSPVVPRYIRSIASFDSIVLAGTWNSGVFISHDEAQSWSKTSLTSGGIMAFSQIGTHLIAGGYGGVFVSEDQGLSWSNPWQGIVFGFAIYKDFIFSATNDGVFVSSDNGINWQTTNFTVRASAIVAKDSLIIVDADGGIFLSSDLGSNWKKVFDHAGWSTSAIVSGPNIIVNSMISEDNGLTWSNLSVSTWVLTVKDSIVYCFGGSISGFGIHRSTNHGQTWKLVNKLDSVLGNAEVLSISMNEPEITLGTSRGILRSVNDGITWIRANDGLMLEPIINDLVANGPSDLCVSTDHGIFFSTDGGSSWMPSLNQTDQGENMSSLDISRVFLHNQKLFAFQREWLLRSTDKGYSWHTVLSAGPQFLRATLDNNRSSILLVSSGCMLYKSEDDGETWTSAYVPFEAAEYNHDMVVNSICLQDSLLYVGALNRYCQGCSIAKTKSKDSQALEQYDAVCVTSDFGATWISLGMKKRNVSSFAIIEDNVFVSFGSPSVTYGKATPSFVAKSFADDASEHGVINVLSIGDTTWRRADSGYSDTIVSQLTTDGRYLFARSSNKLYSFNHSTSNWSLIENGLQTPIRVMRIYNDKLYVISDEIYHHTLSEFHSDTSAPNLTIAALSTPAVNAVRFGVGANETLSSAELKVNSQPVTLTKEGDLYFGTYPVNSPGQLNVHASVTDLSSNTTQTDRSYTVVDLIKSGSFLGYSMKSEDKGYAVLSQPELPQAPSNWEPIGSAIEVLNTNPGTDITIEASYSNFKHEDESKIGIYQYQNDHWEYIGGHGKNGKVSTTIHSGKITVFYNPDQTSIPKEFSLSQNYPNPFNPTTTLRFNVATAGKVTMKVYNILGQEVKTLVNALKEPGYYEVMWDGRSDTGNQVSSGVYLYCMEAGKFIQTRKMLFVK